MSVADKLPSDDYEEPAVDEVPSHEELPVGEEGTYDCEVELLRTYVKLGRF